MKKTLFLIFSLLLGILVNAQDIILKKDGNEIKAKVLEITDQFIKYKDFDFQEGPMRNIKIVDVFMIKYKNGQKEIFSNNLATKTEKQGKDINQNEAATVQNPNHNNSLEKEFSMIGDNDKMMLEFFKKNYYTGYYNDFNSAYRQRNTGISLLVPGIIFSCWGLLFTNYGSLILNGNLVATGYIFFVTGQGLIIASIPVSASAGRRKASIKEDFMRTELGYKDYGYKPSLNVGFTGNGLGISLNF